MQRVERSIRVRTPIERAYQAWRNFENLPQFMENVEAVTVSGPDQKHSHWKLRGPIGTHPEYDAELVEDEPNRSIGWRSLDGELGTSGNVTFTDLGDETQVHVVMQWFDPPGGAIGETASRLLQNPEKMLEEDLRRFKAMMERDAAPGARVA